MSAPAPSLQAVAAQLVMELRLTARRGENVLVIIILPAAALLFFGAVVPMRPAPASGHPVDLLLPACIALAIVATSFVNLGIATAYERSNGVLKRLGGSPLTRGELLAAKIATILLVETVQVAFLVAIAFVVLGWRPAPGANLAGAAIVGLVGTIAFAGLGLLLAGTLRAEATLALANGLFLVALLAGGVVVPIEQLPEPLAALAGVLPAGALAELLRVTLGAGGGEAPASIVVLTLWSVGAVALATLTFRWE